MKEMSEVVGISLSRVSQIREATMAKLRTMLEHMHTNHTPATLGGGDFFDHASPELA